MAWSETGPEDLILGKAINNDEVLTVISCLTISLIKLELNWPRWPEENVVLRKPCSGGYKENCLRGGGGRVKATVCTEYFPKFIIPVPPYGRPTLL